MAWVAVDKRKRFTNFIEVPDSERFLIATKVVSQNITLRTFTRFYPCHEYLFRVVSYVDGKDRVQASSYAISV